MVAQPSKKWNPVINTRGVSCVFNLPPDQHPYLFPLEEAGSFETVMSVEGTRGTVRPGKGSGGKRRKRTVRSKPGHLYFPVVADTEFQTVPHPESGWFHDQVVEFTRKLGRGSIPLSMQFRGITEECEPAIYLHPDYRRLFPKAKPEGLKEAKEPIVDYLSGLLNMDVRFDWKGSVKDDDYQLLSETRKLRIQIFAHFALAELHRIWGDRRIVDYLKTQCRADPENGREEAAIQQGRRLRTNLKIDGNPVPERWLPIPIIAVIGKRKFALEIDFYDNSAMLGNAGRSYKGFMACAGVELSDKDNFTKSQKERMLLQFIGGCDQKGLASGAYDNFLPSSYSINDDSAVALDGGSQTFIDYAIGDVHDLYKGIRGVAEKFRLIYRSLGLERYYTPPKPTTGSTVHEIIRASTYSLFEGAFAGIDSLLTKGDQALMDKAQVNGFGSLTMKQQADYPHWYLGEEEKIPQKFYKLIETQGFEPAMAKNLATKKFWSGINAKVLGGRCVNSAPTLISQIMKPIADVDLKGCYVASMFNQQFPIGRPIILGENFNRNSKRNGFPTLREFLKLYEHELVPSLWQAWISVEDRDGKPIELPTAQEYFPSWKAPTSFFDYNDNEEGIWLERQDQVRHYKRTIFNTPLTHDTLQWLRLVATKELRDFIMKNAVVKTAMFYPASQRKGSSREWVRGMKSFERESKRKNTSKARKNKDGTITTVNENNEYQGWFSVNLADLIARKLRDRRNEWRVITDAYKVIKAKKIKSQEDLDRMRPIDRKKIYKALNSETLGTYPGGLNALIEESKIYKKHPLDELFKLCGNTVYGVVVSRFFTLSNPVVGNNITARCRSIIALYQGACKGWNAITDGGLMRLDEVFYPRNGRTLNHKAGLLIEASNREILNNNMTCAPIGGYDSIAWEGDDLVFVKGGETQRFHKSDARKEDGSGYLDMIDVMILDHVRQCYPKGLDVLAEDSPFTFETKGVVQSAAIHGAGNYYLEGGLHLEGYEKDRDNMVKMRSYSSDIHEKILRPFFLELLNNPEKVDRTKHSEVFITPRILKPGAFSEQWNSYYRHTDLEPGDTVYEARMFRELGLTGFMFNSPDQEKEYRDWHNFNRAIHRERSSIGQSWEGLYLDEEGWYDYRQNINDLFQDITLGKSVTKDLPSQHPNTVKLQHIRANLRSMMLRDPAMKLDPYEDQALDREVSAADIAELEMLYEELPDEAWF